MTKNKPWDIAEEVLIPLAMAYEEFFKTAYPVKFYSHLKLTDALRQHRFEMGRRFFEFIVSPAFAAAFVRTVERPVKKLIAFEVTYRRTPNWIDDDNTRRQYNEILSEIENAADYLRQLAWMISKGVPRDSRQGVKKLTPKGYERLSQKTADLSDSYLGASLTDRQMECFSLRFEYGLPIAEVARRLGIKRPSVDEHLAAATKKITRFLEKNKTSSRSTADGRRS